MINAIFLTEFVVTRMAGNGSYVDGYFVAGSTKTFRIKASCQPLAGKDLLSMSEGDRQKDSLRLYCERELKLGEECVLRASDRILINGKSYEVRTIEDWNRNLFLKHYKAIVVRDNRNDEPKMVVP